VADATVAQDRAAFVAALGLFVGEARAAGSHLGLLLIDLSNLRLINHRHGYEIGDHLLAEAGKQLLAW
jgi:predicted signal transduction protein with EAL and GGDEF domain